MIPRIAIVQFPGSNSEAESIRAVKMAGMQPVPFLWNEDYSLLQECDGFFIVGGFSYEDRSRAGIIASLDPVMNVIRQQANLGKPVLGVCNGAQILVETGMVPGLPDDALGMALGVNKRTIKEQILGTGFYNGWTHIKLAVPAQANAFTLDMKEGDILHLPIAHGEGRFIIPQRLLHEMNSQELTTFQYCDQNGSVGVEFPLNPNGSAQSLAAVSNAKGNVLAMMPHPERTEHGQPLFRSMKRYIVEKHGMQSRTLDFVPDPPDITVFERQPRSFKWNVELKITDNESASVENTLKRLGIYTHIRRLTHWEISYEEGADSVGLEQAVFESGELLNRNKEKIIDTINIPHDNKICFLVRPFYDAVGEAKKAILHDRYGLTDIRRVQRGTAWHISVMGGNIEVVARHILDTHILFNQYSQVCYRCMHTVCPI